MPLLKELDHRKRIRAQRYIEFLKAENVSLAAELASWRKIADDRRTRGLAAEIECDRLRALLEKKEEKHG